MAVIIPFIIMGPFTLLCLKLGLVKNDEFEEYQKANEDQKEVQKQEKDTEFKVDILDKSTKIIEN